MRKILITQEIRDYAEHYKADYIDKFSSIPKSLDDTSSFICMNNSLTSHEKDTIKKLFEELKNDFPTILTLEPYLWEGYKYIYNNILGSTKLLKKKLCYSKKNNGSKTESELFKIILERLKYKEARILLAPYQDKIGIKTCVYCNAQPLVLGKHKVYYEMEHINAKSEFPFLDICFYNLVPVDGECNRFKNDKSNVFDFYANEEKNMSPFAFKVNLNKTFVSPMGVICSEIKFVGNELKPTTLSKKYEEMFHINDRYWGLKKKAEEFIKNYWERKNTGYAHIYSGFNFKGLLDGYVDDENKIFSTELAKLKPDIVKQYYNEETHEFDIQRK